MAKEGHLARKSENTRVWRERAIGSVSDVICLRLQPVCCSDDRRTIDIARSPAMSVLDTFFDEGVTISNLMLGMLMWMRALR